MTVSTVLVTGTSGFIARHVARALLTAGYRVEGLDRTPSGTTLPGYTEHLCDLLDRDRLIHTVRAVSPFAVLHLAARTDLDETQHLEAYSANIEGVSNLLDAVAATPTVTRTVCTSTQLVCPLGYVPSHDEDYRPTTLYGESKVESERRWRVADGAGSTWCIVRPTTIWGPGMNPHYLRFFALVRDGQYFHIAGGPTPKTYGFVGNTADQYRRLLEAPTVMMHRRTFYLADAPPTSQEEWAEDFRRAFGARRIRTMPRWVASALAAMGDILKAGGISRFPFTSFRLRNVLTPSVANLEPTVAVCGPPAIDRFAGITQTARWAQRVWSGASRWSLD